MVGLDNLRSFDGVEVADFCQTWMVLAVLVLQELEPLGCHLYQVSQVAIDFLNLCLDASHEFVSLVLVELQNALHLDFQQLQDVVLRHLANHLRIEGGQALVDVLTNSIDIGCLLELLVLIDALFDEYLLQRTEVQLFQKLALANLQLLTNQVLGAVCRVAQHVADCQELRLVVLNDTAVGRDIDFAVGEGVESIESLVARNARSQLDLYLYFGSCQVLHMTSLDLALLDSFKNTVNYRFCGLGERYLADDERLGIELFYLGTHLQYTTTLSIVILADIDTATCGEVGVEVELLAMQITDGGITNLAEVMRQNLGRQTYGNTLGTLCQQQWEFHRQGDRLFVATIVGHLPVGGLGVENSIEGKLAQSCLNISGSSSSVARQDVTPVTLCVDEQVLLSHLHQCVTNTGVAVGVELHGVSYNVCYLIISAVVHALHGVQNAALYGFQTVLDMWHGTLQNNIGGVVQEPVLIHAAQMMHGSSVETVYGLIVGVSCTLC